MKILVYLTISFGIAIFPSYVLAGNPGEVATNCILDSSEASGSSVKLTFKNRCHYKVFVVWCGDMKYSDKQCGTGKNYYTHSANIDALSSASTTIKPKGRYSYAACKGGIGSGSKGIEHLSEWQGRFTCTKT